MFYEYLSQFLVGFFFFLNERLRKVLGRRRVRGHIWNVPQSFGLFTYGESSRLFGTNMQNVFTSSCLIVPHLCKWNHKNYEMHQAEYTPEWNLSSKWTSFFLLCQKLPACFFSGWPWWKRHGGWGPGCCGRQGKTFHTPPSISHGTLLDSLCVTSGDLRGWRSPMGHRRGQIPHGSLCEEPETPSSRYLFHVHSVKVGTFKGTSSLSSPPSSFSVWWISKDLRKRDWGQHQEGDVRLSGGCLSGRRCVSAPSYNIANICPEALKQWLPCCLAVKCIRNKSAFFAERLYKSMKVNIPYLLMELEGKSSNVTQYGDRLFVCLQGLGTTDSVLIRTMVARAEIDMLDIKAEFLKAYGKTLYSFIKVRHWKRRAFNILQ